MLVKRGKSKRGRMASPDGHCRALMQIEGDHFGSGSASCMKRVADGSLTATLFTPCSEISRNNDGS